MKKSLKALAMNNQSCYLSPNLGSKVFYPSFLRELVKQSLSHFEIAESVTRASEESKANSRRNPAAEISPKLLRWRTPKALVHFSKDLRHNEIYVTNN